NAGVEAGVEKAEERVLGGLHNGLAGDVEGGIEEQWHAGPRVEALDQGVEPPIRIGCHGLEPARPIDVYYGGHKCSFVWPQRRHAKHRRALGADAIKIEPRPRLLQEDYRG